MKVLKSVRRGEIEIPETWAEGERMIAKVIRNQEGRGYNLAVQSMCARVAYGLLCDQQLTPDPTAALAFLMLRICQQKGAGLER